MCCDELLYECDEGMVMPGSFFLLRAFSLFHSGSEDSQRQFVGWTSLGLGRLRLCVQKTDYYSAQGSDVVSSPG